MRDVLAEMDAWRRAGERFAVATVVSTWGSAPRPVGSKLLYSESGGMAGSVSAGCVEGAVIEEGQAALKSGKPRLLTYGVADEEAWEVGLACGGTIQVFVEPSWALDGIYPALRTLLEEREPAAVVNVLEGGPELLNRKLIVFPDGRTQGDLPLAAEVAVPGALNLLAQENGGVVQIEDGTTLFVEVFPLPPRLIIVGAVHIADPLVRIANAAGFDTILVDPRKTYATRERFPHASQILVEWPREALKKLTLDHGAYVVVLTHDPKLDDPALEASLPSEARYVGALGSRRTNQRRAARLQEAGMDPETIGRLHAPIGLDIGGRSPGEIAVSIMAEVVQARNQPVEVHVPQH